MLNLLKFLIAGKELLELDRYRVEMQQARRWLAEFPDAADALDYVDSSARGLPIGELRAVREFMRARRNKSQCKENK